MRFFSDLALATATIYAEARGESHLGRVAVGEVIRNRMRKRSWSVAEVVLAPVQFSCWWWKDPNFVKLHLIEDTDPVVRDCANAWIESERTDFVQGATHYVNLDVAHPPWVDEMEPVVTIGHHTFFKERSV